jgi:hypothetical protein
MRVTNSTRWNTKDITRLIYRVAKDELQAGQLKKANIKVKYARKNSTCLGDCTYGTPQDPRVNMTLNLKHPGEEIDMVQLAHVIAHELAHSKGIHHRDMGNARYGWTDGWREHYSWARAFPVGLNPEHAEKCHAEKVMLQRADAVIKAEENAVHWKKMETHAAAMARKWERRLKRAKTVFHSAYTIQQLAATTVLLADSKLAEDSRGDKILILAL